MPRRSSNAERIARAAEEAEATAAEKKAKKPAKKPAKKTSRKTTSRAKAPPRMKVIWGVAKPGFEAVAHYAYKDKDAAEAEATKRGEEYRVRAERVPMTDDE